MQRGTRSQLSASDSSAHRKLNRGYHHGNGHVGGHSFPSDQRQMEDKRCLARRLHLRVQPPSLQLHVDPAGLQPNWGEMRLLSFLGVTTATGNIQLYCPDVWH